MTYNPVEILLLFARVYSLIVYVGAAAFYVVVLDRSMKDIYPGVRMRVLATLSGRWMALMWTFLLAATVAGLLYAVDEGLITTDLTGLPTLILIEGGVSLAMIVAALLMTYLFLDLRRLSAKRVSSKADPKFDRSELSGVGARQGTLSKLLALTWISFALGVVAILLGILISAG